MPARAHGYLFGPATATALNPNGYGFGRPAASVAAKDSPVDCFYVYPTVSRDRGMNSDLINQR